MYDSLPGAKDSSQAKVHVSRDDLLRLIEAGGQSVARLECPAGGRQPLRILEAGPDAGDAVTALADELGPLVARAVNQGEVIQACLGTDLGHAAASAFEVTLCPSVEAPRTVLATFRPINRARHSAPSGTLRRLARGLSALSEDLPFPYCVIDSAHTRIAFANRACRALFGVSPEEVNAGLSPVPFWYDEADRDRFLARLKAEGRIEGLEIRCRTRDGRTPWALVSSALLEVEGHQFVCTAFQDITRRRESEEEARHATRLLWDAVESIQDGFAVWDAEDRLVLCNETYRRIYAPIAHMLQPGVTFEASVRAFVEGGHIALDSKDGEQWIAERLEEHHQSDAACEQPLSDGRWIMARDRRTSDGRRVGVRTDITEYKSLAQELHRQRDAAQAASLAKSQFLAGMSHELRTPLNAILGFSEVLRMQAYGPLGDARYLGYAGDIHASGAHLLDLINDILDMSKIEAGRYELYKEEFVVAHMVDECLRMVGGRAADCGVSLECRGCAPETSVHADRRALKQCLLNLLSNAIKFTPAGGTVRIEHSYSATALRLTVVDTGPGIPPEHLASVTEAFNQAHGSHSAKKGTGLGLALTRRLLELHGGALYLINGAERGLQATAEVPLA